MEEGNIIISLNIVCTDLTEKKMPIQIMENGNVALILIFYIWL